MNITHPFCQERSDGNWRPQVEQESPCSINYSFPCCFECTYHGSCSLSAFVRGLKVLTEVALIAMAVFASIGLGVLFTMPLPTNPLVFILAVGAAITLISVIMGIVTLLFNIHTNGVYLSADIEFCPD